MSAEQRLEIITEWAQEIRMYCSYDLQREMPIPERRFPYIDAKAQADVTRILRVARGDTSTASDYRGRLP